MAKLLTKDIFDEDINMLHDVYKKIEEYMLFCMNDGAHDEQHIYRVLYAALDLAATEPIDYDVLIAACLLHDIGRDAQFKDSTRDHALVGADMAFNFLREIGWAEAKANHVKACIVTHRYRTNHPPESMEAKILFDADKLDVTGTVGIARTIAYQVIVGTPLYSVDSNGNALDGKEEENPSFFREYNWKLRNVYDKFYTEKAREVAGKRRRIAMEFYETMVAEVSATHETGLQLLKNSLEK